MAKKQKKPASATARGRSRAIKALKTAAGNANEPLRLEGFARIINCPEDESPFCSSVFGSSDIWGAVDMAGNIPASSGAPHGPIRAYRDRMYLEWETAPARGACDTEFVWVGHSLVRPLRPAFPPALATLTIDGVSRLDFPLGVPGFGKVANADGFCLAFEPRRYQSSVEEHHRYWCPGGVGGIYRLRAPAKRVKAGKPLRLRVDLPPKTPQYETVFFVSPRPALANDLQSLRLEVEQLQRDLVSVRMAQERLYAQHYAHLFPAKIRGELVVVTQDPTRHFHPPSITALANGELIVTMREATDHISRDGRMVLVRSSDQGRTWGPRELMFDLGNADHRSCAITELPDGTWIGFDYRCQANYRPDGTYNFDPRDPTLWACWSTDRGRTWSFSPEPLTVPGACAYGEPERHIIRLSSGALLLAANYVQHAEQLTENVFAPTHTFNIAIFRSDDNGRTWKAVSTVPNEGYCISGEPTIVQTRSGKLVLLARSEVGQGGSWTKAGMLFQADSFDEGRTWTPLRSTALSSMSSPGHLIKLADGRLLCSHAARAYPLSIYVTTSDDDGVTWNTDRTRVLADDIANFDSCYPTTAQLKDGSLMTVWYASLFGMFFVAGMRYPLSELG